VNTPTVIDGIGSTDVTDLLIAIEQWSNRASCSADFDNNGEFHLYAPRMVHGVEYSLPQAQTE